MKMKGMFSTKTKETHQTEKLGQQKEETGCYTSMGRTSENVAEKYRNAKEG